MVGSFLSHCDVFVKTPDVPSFQNSPDLFFLLLGFSFLFVLRLSLIFGVFLASAPQILRVRRGHPWQKTFTLGKIWAVQNLWRSAGEILKFLSS